MSYEIKFKYMNIDLGLWKLNTVYFQLVLSQQIDQSLRPQALCVEAIFLDLKA